MQLAKEFFRDETGVVLSAEVVMIGTLGVLGSVVGLNAVTTAVDQELKEFAGAIRSLDQSYGYTGHRSCRAWSAGSYYRQPDVQLALNDLCANGVTDISAIQNQIDLQRKTNLPPVAQPQSEFVPANPAIPPASAIPNQILIPAEPNPAVPALKSDPDKPKRENRKQNRKNAKEDSE